MYSLLAFSRIFIFSDLAVMRLHNLSKQSVGANVFFRFRLIVKVNKVHAKKKPADF